jgi:hypothetical protein
MNSTDKQNAIALRGGLTRRNLLKGFAGGAAGLSVLSLLSQRSSKAAVLGDTSGQANGLWDAQMPSGSSATGTALFYQGSLWIPAYGPAGQFETSLVIQLDMQTGQLLNSYVVGDPDTQDTAVNYVLPPISGSIVAGSTAQRQLYWSIPTGGGTDSWPIAGLPLLVGNYWVGYSLAANALVAFTLDDPPTPLWTGPAFPPPTKVCMTMTANGVLVAATDNLLTALNVNSGALLWQLEPKLDGIIPILGVPKGICVSGGSAYVTSSTGVLLAFDLSNGQLLWSSNQIQASLSEPAAYAGMIYLADSAGFFYAFDPSTRGKAWQTELTSGLDQAPIFVEDGVAYLSAVQSSGSTLYAVDLKSQGADTISYSAGNGGAILGVDNGITYFVHNNSQNVAAANFQNQLHQFYCQSTLMPDTAIGSSSNPQPSTPTYRTQIQLLDVNRNPRVNKGVKVWASDTVTLTAGGQTYNIDTMHSASLSTDGAGHLALVVQANDISCPALYVWSDFMDANEAMMIYPDHDTMNTLSQVQGADLDSATRYDNTKMLPSDFTSSSALAQAIANTIGNTTVATQQTQLRLSAVAKAAQARNTGHRRPPRLGAGPNTYIAYPNSTPNLVYNPDTTANSPARSYSSGAVKNFTVTFTPDNQMTFTPQDSATVGATQLLGLSLHDFVTNVVNGVRKVAKIVATTGAQILHQIEDDLGQLYSITITAVEDAVNVVKGILKTIIGDITAAIEWLSYVFDWKGILATKDTIKTNATAGIQKMISWANGLSVEAQTTIQTKLAGYASQIAADISAMSSQLGSNSMQSYQQNGNDPTTVYGYKGANSYTQTHWCLSRVTDNARNSTSASSALSAKASLLNSSPPDGFVQIVMNLYNTVKSVLNGPDFQSIGADLAAFGKNFGTLMTNPSQFVTNSFADLLGAVAGIAETVLQLISAVIVAFLEAIPALLQAALDVVQFSISIPGVNDIWQAISGSSLTMLDLLSLVVAIPTTIISKAISGGSSAQASTGTLGGSPTQLLGIAGILNGLIYAVIDGWGDLSNSDANGGQAGADLATTIVGTGLSGVLSLSNATDLEIMFYVMSAVPLMYGSINLFTADFAPEFQKDWSEALPWLNLIYGLGMVGASITGAIKLPAQFSGQSSETLLANLFTFIPYIGKVFAVGDAYDDNRIAVCTVDGVCDTAAAIVNGVAVLQSA